MNVLAPQILKETHEWLAVDKPAGWLSIAGRSEGVPVLSEWLKAKYGEVFTVHRLDRETSGLLLFARTAEAHKKASLWFQNRETKKFYVCLAQGQPALPVFKIQKPIEGAACSTQVEVKEEFRNEIRNEIHDAFLAHVRPLTGRRHQIRIHLAGEGYPILGDPLYGGPRSLGDLNFSRVALHAMRLELPSGERFEAPLPQDFSNWLNSLRGSTR